MDDAAAGLVGGEDEQFGHLHVLGSVHGKGDALGDIGSRERLDTLIDAVGTLLVTVETGD